MAGPGLGDRTVDFGTPVFNRQGTQGAILARAGAFALASLWLGSALVGIFLVTGTTSVTRRGVSLAQGLAAAAREVARTGRARIPHTDRSDEIGELARALQAWQGASAEREVMIEQAPVGICQLDSERRVVTASPAFLRMLDLSPEQVRDQFIRSFIHPDDLELALTNHARGCSSPRASHRSG